VLPNGAIGARLSPDGVTLYVTDATGLGIYDVTNPASPQIRSHVPLPRVGGTGAMHLVDVSDPAAGGFWGAYLAPSDCPPLGSTGRVTGRTVPSPIGEWDRLASWGRGSVPSPTAPVQAEVSFAGTLFAGRGGTGWRADR
jgi:hypothetical protein